MAVLHRRDFATYADEEVDLAVADRVEAARALATIDGGAAILALARAVQDPADQVRTVALDALARSGDSSASGALARAVARWPDADAAGRQGAERALLALDAPDRGLELAEAILATPRAPGPLAPTLLRLLLLESGDPTEADRCIARLVAGLRDPDPGRRGRSEILLAWLGDLPLEALLAALADDQGRAAIAGALGRTLERRAGQALVGLLGDANAEVRRAAVLGLAEIADPRTVDAMMLACDDDDHAVRISALQAVNSLGIAAMSFAMAGAVRSDVAQLAERVQALAVRLDEPSPPALAPVAQRALEPPLEAAAPRQTDGLRRLQRLFGRR